MHWRETSLYKDRLDAARKLAPLLKKYANDEKAILIALPRGGVPMGNVLANELSLPLDIVVPRKIGHPDHMEYAIGALTETGEIEADPRLMTGLHGGLNNKRVQKIIADEKAEASRRLREYRGDRPPLNLANKTVILIDDGIATGYTMKAAIKSARARGASKIVVAAPVCAPDSAEALKKVADEVVCAATPDPFSAVGLWYERFDQTSDQEVISIMKISPASSSGKKAQQSESHGPGSKQEGASSASVPKSASSSSAATSNQAQQGLPSQLAGDMPLPEAAKQQQKQHQHVPSPASGMGSSAIALLPPQETELSHQVKLHHPEQTK
jgi:predicted phosphoribosyltransferase